MPQNEQFDVLGELTAPSPDDQPQHRREREVSERKDHPPMLSDRTPDCIESRNLVLEPLTFRQELPKLLKDRGMSLRALARESGVGHDQLSRALSGERGGRVT